VRQRVGAHDHLLHLNGQSELAERGNQARIAPRAVLSKAGAPLSWTNERAASSVTVELQQALLAARE
jgi:hypothetical protein